MATMRRLRRWLREFARDVRGNVAILFGLSVIPLAAAAGLAVDAVLAYTVEDELQRALDAAGLAAGRTALPEHIEADARAYFESNLASGAALAASSTAFSVEVSPDGFQLTLTATAHMPTAFMRVFGMDDVTLTASTVINRQVRQMELALVLDNTGSMLGSPFTAMQSAAKELVEIVYGDHETHANLYVAVVPFVAVVNVGPAHTAWLAAGDPAIAGTAYKPSAWKGCVMARTTGKGDNQDYDQTDDPPAVRAFQGYLYPDASDNDWGAPRSPPVREQLTAYNDGYGPNLGCGPPILPLTASRTAVLAALDGMGPWHRGGTAGNEGVAWGWRVLSPRWRGLWGGATPGSRPLDYDVADNDKVVVMLTDGNNNVYDHPPAGPRGSDHTSMGRLADFMHSSSATAAQGKTEWDNRMLNVCGRMKARGVIVYTITFGSTPSSSTKTLYRTCATKPAFYFHSPTNGELRNIFRTIGMQLSNLRISR